MFNEQFSCSMEGAIVPLTSGDFGIFSTVSFKIFLLR
jgi:hypothetical protein